MYRCIECNDENVKPDWVGESDTIDCKSPTDVICMDCYNNQYEIQQEKYLHNGE
jgi:hypothetical protein